MTVAIELQTLATFALLWAAIVPTPGANAMLIVHVALERDWRHVLLTLAGNLTGVALLALAALFGLAGLMALFPWARLAIAALGAIYLVYFGAVLVRRGLRRPPTRDGTTFVHATTGNFGLGLATALANAQAIVFITSIFAAAHVIGAGLATGLACVAAMIALNGGYLLGLAWVLRRPTARAVYMRFRGAIETTIGALFLALGGRALLQALRAP